MCGFSAQSWSPVAQHHSPPWLIIASRCSACQAPAHCPTTLHLRTQQHDCGMYAPAQVHETAPHHCDLAQVKQPEPSMSATQHAVPLSETTPAALIATSAVQLIYSTPTTRLISTACILYISPAARIQLLKARLAHTLRHSLPPPCRPPWPSPGSP